jgi:hypothetical protein
MILDREELNAKIDTIPTFEEVSVAIKDSDWIEQEQDKAIREVGSPIRIAYVSKRYVLVQLKSTNKMVLAKVPGDIKGNVMYWHGRSIMDIFPMELSDDDGTMKIGKIGIVMRNSVDKTSSFGINFCTVTDDGWVVSLPTSIAGFKRQHSSKDLNHIAIDYADTIGRVQEEWQVISEKFPTIEVSLEQLKILMAEKKFNFTDKEKATLLSRYAFKVAEPNGKNKFTVWDFFNGCINMVATNKYKTEVHKRQKLDTLVESILQYGFLTRL